MAVVLGRIQKAAFNNGGGYTDVGRIVDGSLEMDSAEVNVTTHDSGAWEEFLQGRGNMTATLNCLYDEADAGQDAVIAAYVAQTAGTLRFRMRGNVPGGTVKEIFASAFVKSCPQSAPNDEAGEAQFVFRLTGTPTRQNQP